MQEAKDTPNEHIHDRSLCQIGTDISIKSSGAKPNRNKLQYKEHLDEYYPGRFKYIDIAIQIQLAQIYLIGKSLQTIYL